MTQHGKINGLDKLIYEICPEIHEYFLHISLMAEWKTIRNLNTTVIIPPHGFMKNNLCALLDKVSAQ